MVSRRDCRTRVARGCLRRRCGAQSLDLGESPLAVLRSAGTVVDVCQGESASVAWRVPRKRLGWHAGVGEPTQSSHVAGHGPAASRKVAFAPAIPLASPSSVCASWARVSTRRRARRAGSVGVGEAFVACRCASARRSGTDNPSRRAVSSGSRGPGCLDRLLPPRTETPLRRGAVSRARREQSSTRRRRPYGVDGDEVLGAPCRAEGERSQQSVALDRAHREPGAVARAVPVVPGTRRERDDRAAYRSGDEAALLARVTRVEGAGDVALDPCPGDEHRLVGTDGEEALLRRERRRSRLTRFRGGRGAIPSAPAAAGNDRKARQGADERGTNHRSHLELVGCDRQAATENRRGGVRLSARC